MFDAAGISFQGHMPIKKNACILVLVVTLLIAVSSYGMCTIIYLSNFGT